MTKVLRLVPRRDDARDLDVRRLTELARLALSDAGGDGPDIALRVCQRVLDLSRDDRLRVLPVTAPRKVAP